MPKDPDVRFEFIPFDGTASGVDAVWARPGFLEDEPDNYLLKEKQELFDWFKEVFPDCQIHMSHSTGQYRDHRYWSVYFLGDTTNAGPTLVKLTWGDQRVW